MLHQAGNRFNAQELWQQDHDHVLHPYQHFDSFKKEGSLVIVEGDGCYVTDAQGRRYLDGIGGMWCVNAGYGRKEIAETMAEQALQLCYSNFFVDVTNAPAARLAAKLAELAPGDLNHVVYATSGSCAVDTAIRLAHFYQSRRGQGSRRYVISRKNSYHGSTYLGMTVGLRDGDQSQHFKYIPDLVHHLSAPYPYRRPEGMTPEAFSDFLVNEFEDRIAELGAENIACFIAEPAQASGGVTLPPPNYLPRMRELCTKHGILFIADEIVTAFGRLGHFFASKDVFGIEPDMILTAKGLTSGYIPLSAVIYSDKVHEVISAPDPDVWFTHGYTYAGHPVACAVALKNIEIIEREDLCGNAARVGDYLEKRLGELRDLEIVGDVRGRRLMMCVEYVRDKKTRERLPDSCNISKRISNACEAEGLLVRPIGHLDVLSPPLTITREQVDFVVDTLKRAIVKAVAELKAEGVI
ncbi:aminotransferase [Aestuariivirga litoralis]|uniref:Aminotransferase n=1 Tax=Aestuariivirga litoralis TaxID=2650924 RepID=A0A2W2AT69_9HYPH|nr:aminotransferase [Aestuariivirga litoralis]PZF76862.1 aminotransferase [Aestuariivirga litoralis]